MDLSPYVEALRRDLLAAAAAGTDDTRRTAELLAAALEPAVRLSIMDALSAATADVTAALSGVTVEVRLHGRVETLADRATVAAIVVSLSHCDQYAIAIAWATFR